MAEVVLNAVSSLLIFNNQKMVDLRKKATLTPKLYQGLVSNVKESFYLFDYTKCPDPSVRNAFIDY